MGSSKKIDGEIGLYGDTADIENNKEQSFLQSEKILLRKGTSRNVSIHEGFIWAYNESQMRTYERISEASIRLFEKSEKVSFTMLNQDIGKRAQQLEKLRSGSTNPYQLVFTPLANFKGDAFIMKRT